MFVISAVLISNKRNSWRITKALYTKSNSFLATYAPRNSDIPLNSFGTCVRAKPNFFERIREKSCQQNFRCHQITVYRKNRTQTRNLRRTATKSRRCGTTNTKHPTEQRRGWRTVTKRSRIWSQSWRVLLSSMPEIDKIDYGNENTLRTRTWYLG